MEIPLKKSKYEKPRVELPFDANYSKIGPDMGIQRIPEKTIELPVPGILPEDPIPMPIPR